MWLTGVHVGIVGIETGVSDCVIILLAFRYANLHAPV